MSTACAAVSYTHLDVYKRQTFMSRFPGYPIMKVRVAPGEAYIAPTDNMIHDASTVGSKTPSVTLTLRGWFTVPGGANRRDAMMDLGESV